MAESLVSFLLAKMELFIKEETELLRGIRGQVESIRDELEHMRAFLRVAESREETDPQAGVWIKQVREIAFEIEDVIDEFTLRLGGDQKDGFRGFISKIISIKDVNYRHQLASEIGDIRSRIDTVSKGYQTYKFNVPDNYEASSSYAATKNMWDDHRKDALLLEQTNELVGINEPKRQLIEWLTEGDLAVTVISVVGMGGLGKTTLAKEVFDDPQVMRHFKNHVRVSVSQSFKIEELLKDMIRQLHNENDQSTPPEIETMASQSLKATIRKFLQESRYLVVLDDVWNVNDWDAIKLALPQNRNGSRVMLTTRIGEVAHAPSIGFKGQVYHLLPLSFEASWSLFCKITFQGHDCPSHLISIVQHILQKCEGLPLAVVTISGVLAKKDTSKIHEWEMVKSNLGGELEGNKLQSMTKILLVSYYDLPFYLKACLLYFSILPEDYAIEHMRLVRLWIAEGFVEEKDGKTLEEVAESYLDELLDRSLIQVASVDLDGKILAYRIHDLLREVILTKAKEQNFVLIYNGRNTTKQEKVRRLAIHHSLENADEKKHIFRLRSLLVFGVEDSPLTLLGHYLKLVRVLDLRGTNLEIFPNEVLKLYHLRYLSLKNTKVKTLPTSINKLQNLETLDLEGTLITKLPNTIVDLRHLRHLLVFHYSYTFDYTSRKTYGFVAILGIGFLRLLQHLCYMDVNEGNAAIQELGLLSELRLLWIGNLRKEDGKILCNSIDKLYHLRNLSIRSADDETIDLHSITKPPKFLERLYLEGNLEIVPHWITCLTNLRKLSLRSSQLMEEILEPIQDLPNLVSLNLENAFDGEELKFKAKGFPKLNYLWLKELPRLKWVEMEKGLMPCIEKLSIVRCKLLQKVPFGIENLAKLQRLKLADISMDLITTIDLSKGGEDYRKVKHVPSVDLSYFHDGQWKTYHL